MSCATCASPHRREIERRVRAGSPATDIERWLRETDAPISRLALGRHIRGHMALTPVPGRRPMNADFATAVAQRAHERLEAGELEPGVADGLKATQILDARRQTQADRDLLVRIALAMTGHAAIPAAVDPELEALEGEFRTLTEGGEPTPGNEWMYGSGPRPEVPALPARSNSATREAMRR